jgi:hypothetical protein
MWIGIVLIHLDPGLDRHQKENSDTDRHENDADPQHCQ